MFDQALLIASSNTDLEALARSLILLTTSSNQKRQESMESAEINCLVALMSHEKNNENKKPSFKNILSLLDKTDLEPVLAEVWHDSADQAFRKAILGSLSMRLIQISS